MSALRKKSPDNMAQVYKANITNNNIYSLQDLKYDEKNENKAQQFVILSEDEFSGSSCASSEEDEDRKSFDENTKRYVSLFKKALTGQTIDHIARPELQNKFDDEKYQKRHQKYLQRSANKNFLQFYESLQQ